MSIKIPSSTLDQRLNDLGLLIGLLTPRDDGDFNLNIDWFKNPVTDLKQIPSDTTNLIKLLRDILGTPAAGTPSDRAWYALNWNGQPSGVYVVLPLTSETTSPATVGIGLWQPFTSDPEVKITGWMYFPLFDIPVSSPVIITGRSNHPAVITLEIQGTFSAGPISFGGIEFQGDIFFSDNDPGFNLTFVNMQPPSTITTLAGLQGASVTGWVNAVLANSRVGAWLETNIPSTSKKIGDVLVSLKLLQLSGAQYQLGTLTDFENKTPAQIAEELLAVALQALASNEKPVVTLGDGGIFVIGEQVGAPSDQVTDYGLRLQVADIKISGSSDADSGGNGGGGSSDSSGDQPELVVQMGKWLTGESDQANWASRANPGGQTANPGISILLVRVGNNDSFSFHPRVELVSLGFDFKGSDAKPLVDFEGFQLGGVEPRFYLSLDFSDLTKIPWGCAIRCDKLGLPLGAGLTGSAGNPVAQNLLSAGSNGSSGAGADNQTVNPAFSAAVAWISDPANSTEVNFQLYAPDDTPSDKVWIPVQRAFGPLHCQRLGVEWPQPNADLMLSFLFDGEVALGGLEVDLEGLSVGIPLKTPGDLGSYELGLDGIDITLSEGPVEISGGLLEAHVTVDGKDVLEYNGEALIKAASWSISALGSWATLNGAPSLFIFAFLDATIGGPTFFFVTGLSAGFGYNRSLTLPAQDQVQDYPFVAGLTDPSKIGGADAGPGEALKALGDLVQPAQGVNWLAAGVQFTSFELINSNALVVVQFGNNFQIAILGLSRMKLPQAGSETFAYVELGLEVIIDPSDGLFSATAVISPNSYVIDPACHLTGGFAFCVWFGDSPHSGDFVLTIGGYHPMFNKPLWYPDEPRLGFSWQVSDQITVSGTAYFALTPSCVMGGGSLDVEFHSGDLAAWFTSHADFLVQWKPFYYIAEIGVSMGVSYRLHLLFTTVTLKVELGADLTMWGPPTGGKVHVHLWFVSFTVSFGPDFGQGNDYLDWNGFQTLLPQSQQPKPKQTPHRLLKASPTFAAVADAGGLPTGNVITLTLNRGKTKKSDGRWLVRADELMFSVQTAFPLTEIDLDGKTTTKVAPPTLAQKDTSGPSCARTADGYYVGVRPMGVLCVDSVLTLTVTDDVPDKLDLSTGWTWETKTMSVPEATWGQPIPQTATPAPAANTLPGRLVGLQNIVPPIHQPEGPDAIPSANLSYDPINPDAASEKYLPFPQAAQTGMPQGSATTLQTIATTITQNSAANSPMANRAGIFNALAAFGYGPAVNSDLTALAANVNLSYPAPPMLESPVGG